MRTQVISLISILFPFFLFAQENTSTVCSDGIDNDGDGFIDCLDNECASLANNGCQICFDDGSSFADIVISFEPKCASNTNTDPQAAIGVSDFTATGEDVSLGEGGSITLGFNDNILVNSGDDSPDLWVFEVGPQVEASELELRPFDPNTILILNLEGILDSDMDGYFDFGVISGSTSSIDIDNIVAGYPLAALKFDAVQITDVPGVCSGRTPGADIDAVCALSSLIVDCAGAVNGTAVLDQCGECLEPSSPDFNQACVDCAGAVNGTAVLDQCGECLEPSSPDFNQACVDCAGAVNGTAVLDQCGECLEPSSPDFNQACVDCAGAVNGTAALDQCGECLEPSSPDFNQACVDCAGAVNGTAVLDQCGECLEPSSPDFNQACADCAGAVNGTAVLDQCGECLEPSSPDFNQACVDCAGAVNGTAVLDQCGECLEPSSPDFNQACADCAGAVNGTAVLDQCGECLEPSSPDFNQACVDCAGAVNGTAVLDQCGECLEPSSPDFNQACVEENIAYIPNSFSPNDDNINDTFQIFKKKEVNGRIKQYLIFNRWGGLLFESKDFDFDSNLNWWNGEFNGNKMPTGVYIYYVEIEFQNNVTKEYKGGVMLLK